VIVHDETRERVFQVDRVLLVSLDRNDDQPTRIVVRQFPIETLTGSIQTAMPEEANALDDDLANATWEDAEWQ
jgi:hypothetical protein